MTKPGEYWWGGSAMIYMPGGKSSPYFPYSRKLFGAQIFGPVVFENCIIKMKRIFFFEKFVHICLVLNRRTLTIQKYQSHKHQKCHDFYFESGLCETEKSQKLKEKRQVNVSRLFSRLYYFSVCSQSQMIFVAQIFIIVRGHLTNVLALNKSLKLNVQVSK